MRYVTEPSLSKLSRWMSTPARSPRMRRPSTLPTVYPTKSSYLQRFLWLFTS